MQYKSPTRQTDSSTAPLLSHAPILILKIIADRNIPTTQPAAPKAGFQQLTPAPVTPVHYKRALSRERTRAIHLQHSQNT